MNDISAVICELNPMHEGHEYIFEKAREHGGTVVAVMSGNFVQRGECAVFDKYKRAKAALSSVDLVVELPFPWSASSAEFFASSAVSIAERLGAESLVFGSECGDISALKKAAAVIGSEEYRKAFFQSSAAAAKRGELLSEMCSDVPESVTSSPNDILACEYCRFAKRADLHAVKRINAPTASSLRETLDGGDTVCTCLAELEFHFFRTRKEAPAFAECGGGVGERLYKSAFEATCAAEMFAIAATKQYTNARLRRAALFSMTGVTMDMLRLTPEYTSVLAANEKGRALLSSIRNKSEIAVITNPSDGGKLTGRAREQFLVSAFADSVYTLCMKDKMRSDVFLRKNPYIM